MASNRRTGSGSEKASNLVLGDGWLAAPLARDIPARANGGVGCAQRQRLARNRAQRGWVAVPISNQPEMIVNSHRFDAFSPRLLPVAVLLLNACAARTDDKYNGEALFSLNGVVTDHRTSPPPEANLYLVWPNPKHAGAALVAETIELHPTFPVTFTLDVFTPPPVIQFPDAPRFNEGIFVAGTSAAFGFLDGTMSVTGGGLLGLDPRHLLMYIPDGASAGGPIAITLHGSAAPGFHIVDERCISPAKAAEIRACIAGLGPQADDMTVVETCGTLNPDLPWLSFAPDDLDTALTVELFDAQQPYQPDPAECI